MARSVKLRELRGGERKILRAKLRDLSLAARIHQRYRVIEEVRRGRSIMEAAERAGCHFTIAYDLAPSIQPQRVCRGPALGRQKHRCSPKKMGTIRARTTLDRLLVASRAHQNPRLCLRKSGGQGVNRTLDTRIFSPLLYRLSYLPTVTAAGSAGGASSKRSFVSSRTVPCNRTKKHRRFHIVRF